jgi:DNA-binding transcriptional LysR family regulator
MPASIFARNEKTVNILLDIGAFLATARAGSFSAAGRDLGVATSVITKRVRRLEDHLKTQLFVRTTRRLALTLDGERLRPRLQLLVGEIEETLATPNTQELGLTGSLRIKAPTTLTSMFFGDICAAFQAANPRVKLEIVLLDRSVNPLEEGFDVAVGALPQSYAYVIDHPLCPYPRALCAAPSYFANRRRPKTPTELVGHECITFHTIGTTWTFQLETSALNVEITSNFTANDSRILLAAARQGLGLAILPRFLTQSDLDNGMLEEVMPEFPVEPLWVKASVPRIKMNRNVVAEFIAYAQKRFAQGIPTQDIPAF